MDIPDNYDAWEHHEREQEKALSALPVCSECDNPIQDEKAFYINGEWICEKCMSDYHVYVDNY